MQTCTDHFVGARLIDQQLPGSGRITATPSSSATQLLKGVKTWPVCTSASPVAHLAEGFWRGDKWTPKGCRLLMDDARMTQCLQQSGYKHIHFIGDSTTRETLKAWQALYKEVFTSGDETLIIGPHIPDPKATRNTIVVVGGCFRMQPGQLTVLPLESEAECTATAQKYAQLVANPAHNNLIVYKTSPTAFPRVMTAADFKVSQKWSGHRGWLFNAYVKAWNEGVSRTLTKHLDSSRFKIAPEYEMTLALKGQQVDGLHWREHQPAGNLYITNDLARVIASRIIKPTCK